MAKAKRLGANSPRPIQQARRFGRTDIPYAVDEEGNTVPTKEVVRHD